MLAEKAAPMALETEVERKSPYHRDRHRAGRGAFLAEAKDEVRPFFTLLRDPLTTNPPAVIAVFIIRSDNYERLQNLGVHQETINLPPMTGVPS